jgi:uncharacterized protein YxjI
MKYKIKQKVLSLGDSFIIKDEYDNDRFTVRGKLLSFGSKLRIYDLAGSEVVYIKQELFHLLPRYNIFLKDNYAATVKKELSFLKSSFSIESTMGNYTMEGEIFSHEFQILKDGREVAYVSKKWFSFSDTYGADIIDSENQEFMLSLVIVIDQILYDNKSN